MRIQNLEPRRRFPAGGRLAFACALLFSACRSPAPSAPPNIVVIVVDTLRADRLGWYGGGRGVTPSLDRFAERGAAVFWNAYAQGSSTSPSIASLLTSRHVSQHGVVSNVGTVLAESEVTIAEVLKAHGYATGAFFGNYLLTAENGFAQGFDVAEELLLRPRPDLPKPRAAAVNEAAVAWVDGLRSRRTGRPLFLYVHYMEPHLPYTVPGEIVDRLLERRGRSPDWRSQVHAALADREEQLSLPRLLPRLFAGLPAAGRRESMRPMEDLYDAEVTDVDARIGELLAALEQRGVLEHGVVVFVSDHGEEFFEHGRLGHGAALYNETVHVPLALFVSGRSERIDLREVVSLVDVAPTLLDLAGIPVPPTFVGRSFGELLAAPSGWLQRVFAADGPQERTAFLEQDKEIVRGSGNHRRALVAAKLKVVQRRDGKTEFFDLEADPEEQNGDALGLAERRRLLDLLETARRAAEEGAVAPRVEEPSEAAKERLRALGYLE